MTAESVRLITRIRIFRLRNALACGVSPFEIIDFSPWMKLRRFSQDWFFRTLQEGFDLKISFKPIFDPFNLKGQFPLVHLISFDNQLLNSLAHQQIYFLSQLVTEDGLFLLSWVDLRSLLLVSLKGPTPGWFKVLIGLVTLPSSYALRPEFYIQDELLPNFSVPFIAHEYGTSSSKKLWIATTSCRLGKHALDAPPDEQSIRSSDL
ncbi:hypothetical protein RhiirC2_803819, partial [Rhizophagus irregularis]